MKFTNKLNLPQPIVDAVTNDPYTKGDSDISITGLLNPPKITVLQDKFYAELEEDISDRIWALMGQAMHNVLEKAEATALSEERLTMEVDGLKVSGKFDRFVIESGTLQDYKFVTAYKFKNGQAPLEYEQQLNCYAELLRQAGHEVKALEIVGILRDWSKLAAQREDDYPQTQVIRVPVPMWDSEKVMRFIREKVAALKAARISLPECTDEERWARPTKWAVMKAGVKKAVRLHDTKEAAETMAKAKGAGHYVEFRQGESVRCANYCPVSAYCSQFKREKK